jgi:hypothetical protein
MCTCASSWRPFGAPVSVLVRSIGGALVCVQPWFGLIVCLPVSITKGVYEHRNHRYRTFKQNTRSATCRREAEKHNGKSLEEHA